MVTETEMIIMSDIIKFYRGEKCNSKHILENVWCYTSSQLETIHDYIQWLFPLNVVSECQPYSPILTEEDIFEFRSSNELKLKIIKSVQVFMNFLKENQEIWVTKFNHNHLRITRMLRFLTLIGLEYEANARLQEILMIIFEKDDDRPLATAYKFWAEALCQNS